MAEYPRPLTEGRSANMRANRRTDTKPEMALRRALHRRGYRYRKDYRLDLAGGTRVRPDIAFTARRVAVFVDGCFWHACPEHGSKPANNVWYWEPKLRRNVERDRAADAALTAAGWNVVRIWEHEPLDAAMTAVLVALNRPRQAGAGAGAAAPGGAEEVVPGGAVVPGEAEEVAPGGADVAGAPGGAAGRAGTADEAGGPETFREPAGAPAAGDC